MATTQILAPGTANTQSADISISDGVTAAFILRGNGSLNFLAKGADGGYEFAGFIDNGSRVGRISGPVTIAVQRIAQVNAVGCDMTKD